MSEGGRESSFWVSYSDLATGLMIVFMLVMLLMVALQKKQSEAQQEAVEAVVQKLQVILGTKPKFFESLQEGFKRADSDAVQNLEIDSVTAQLEIQEDFL